MKWKMRLVFFISLWDEGLYVLVTGAQYPFHAWHIHELLLMSRFKILSISVFTVIRPTYKLLIKGDRQHGKVRIFISEPYFNQYILILNPQTVM